MDLLQASKKAFRTLRHHSADISYILPLQILAQLKAAIEEEEERRAHLDTLQDDITAVLFDPHRIKSLNQAGEIADEIVALVTQYLAWDEHTEESQDVQES